MKTSKNLPLSRSLIGVALLLAGAFALWAAISGQTQGAISFGILYLVDSTGDGDLVGPSTSCDDGTGHCTLRAAIEASNLNAGADFIGFNIPTSDPGFSNGTWTINLPRALPDISDAVSVNGLGPDKLTVNGGSTFRIFNITTSGTVSLSGLTMANGEVVGDNGGTIQNYNAGILNVTNCVLTDSANAIAAVDGGGIYNRGGGVVNLTRCKFFQITASNNGGCIYNSSTGRVTVTTSTLSDSFAGANGGSAGNGGGVYNLGTMTVTNSTVYFNSANDIGGGICNVGTVTVTNSTLYDNIAYNNEGGGIYNADFATMNVINSTIYGNNAYFAESNPSLGGGIYNQGALNVNNSTISGNSAFANGGGIYNDSQATGNATVKSTIIANNSTAETNSDPDVTGSFTSQGFNLVGKRDGSTGFTAATDLTGTVASPLHPKLDHNGPQNTGGPTPTISLLSGSPAIDKGNSTTIGGVHLTTDQRGVGYSRTIDNASIANAADGTDIGAFEFGAHIKAVSRKTHGTAGKFDIKLPLFGPVVGVECRKGGASGNFKLIITFPSAVTVGNATATPDPNAPGATGSVSSFSVSGSKVTVDLTGVSNAQRLLVTLSSVSDGTNTNDVDIPMGLLLGDTTGDGAVDSADVTLTQSEVGQTVNTSNFREDVTIDGSIDSKDVNLVQSKVGTGLP